LIKIVIKEENFKWHLEAFASELFMYKSVPFEKVQPQWQLLYLFFWECIVYPLCGNSDEWDIPIGW